MLPVQGLSFNGKIILNTVLGTSITVMETLAASSLFQLMIPCGRVSDITELDLLKSYHEYCMMHGQSLSISCISGVH